MVRASEARRVRQEIARTCEEGLDWVQLSEAVGGQVRRLVPYDAACWHTIDPATLLLTGNATEHLPEGGLPVLARCEYAHEDVNKWGFLARQESSVGRLSVATQGQLELSHRYRVLLQPGGLGRELRASFVDPGGCWGSAGLYRGAGEPDFTEEEEGFVRSIVQVVGLGYRRALVVDLLAGDSRSEGPGLLVLDGRNEIEAVSAAGESWLSQLFGGSPESAALPLPILALTERVRAGQRTQGAEAGGASVRVRASSGAWLSISATPLRRGSDGQIGLTIEPAGPPELAQLLMRGYGLTEREREVTYAVLRGESTKEIARGLFISPYTVQDHLKGIFGKLDVNSRRELVSRIYSQHYLPLVAAGRSPTPSGWFGAGVKPTSVRES